MLFGPSTAARKGLDSGINKSLTPFSVLDIIRSERCGTESGSWNLLHPLSRRFPDVLPLFSFQPSITFIPYFSPVYFYDYYSTWRAGGQLSCHGYLHGGHQGGHRFRTLVSYHIL
jgi:hypothetical protein